MRLLDFLVDQFEARRHGGDVDGRRFDRASRDDERLLSQDAQDLGRTDAANTMGLQQARDTALAQAGGLGGRPRQNPEVEEPVGGDIVVEFEALRIIARELRPDAVGEPVAFLLDVLGHARPLARLDHDRVFGRERPEAMTVGSERVGVHVGIAAIVLAPATERRSWKRSIC